MENYKEETMNEAVREDSAWQMQSERRPLALPLFEEMMAEHCSYHSLRFMCEELRPHAVQMLGRRAPSEYVLGKEQQLLFDRDLVASTRLKEKSCDELHCGLCRSHPQYRKAKVLAQNLFTMVRSFDDGNGLTLPH